jgi:hypothetical protein
MLPCPACLEEKNPHIQVMLTGYDRTVLDFEPETEVADLFPPSQQWLAERIV